MILGVLIVAFIWYWLCKLGRKCCDKKKKKEEDVNKPLLWFVCLDSVGESNSRDDCFLPPSVALFRKQILPIFLVSAFAE